MFDRFIRLARAKKALHEQRYLDALQAAADPVIAGDRRAEGVRTAAIEALRRRLARRIDDGELAAARADLRRLEQAGADDACAELASRLGRLEADAEARKAQVRAVIEDARRLSDAGELQQAEVMLASLQAAAGPECAALGERLAARRAAARDAATQLLSRDLETAAAVAELRRVFELDRDLPVDLRNRLVERVAAMVVVDLDSRGDARDLPEIADRLRRHVAMVPELADAEALRTELARLGERASAALQEADSILAAASIASAAVMASLPISAAETELVKWLSTVEQSPANVMVLADLERSARACGAERVAVEAAQALAAATDGEERLAIARAQLDQGHLEAARRLLVAFLAEHPLHATAQRDLALVDQGLADLDRKLAEVRLALRAGRLRSACTGAMALVGSERIAREAQQLLAEARSRMALVDRGLDEVRVALHGRTASSPEGVRHCLRRLEELAKVQQDHESLPATIEAVEVELESLDLCERLSGTLSKGLLDDTGPQLELLVQFRAKLLSPERLDAHLCRIGDDLAGRAHRAVDAGRLEHAEVAARQLDQLVPVRGDFGVVAADVREHVVRRREAAATAVALGRAALAEGDLATSEQRAEEALMQWMEDPSARRLAAELRALRRHGESLQKVAALAAERDFAGAHERLAALPPVPGLLRTRIYDMKCDLIRAQGLGGSFLLRVDEGGEHLVLRGETATIGNVRQARCDLPVLANLAGCHASIRRSMSFHGGLQDTVVAEQGEVRVGDHRVEKHVLQHGDRVLLGSSLRLCYRRPSSRSLTAAIQLLGGFQVAGTDRVLLLKDRGRDGRILLGASRDVHISVPRATGELEVFAGTDGQMRVACATGGTIDGVAFRGEHPVGAGQRVEAAGVSLVMLPWRAGQ